jgi:diadenosine tetraphosphatase ApaH/serine/threonine PP2A family protein phosphatase
MLALLYDIHGNLPALEAVIADAEDAGAERYFLGGDYTLFGGWPVECVERLTGLQADWIRGNGERWTADPDAAPEPARGASALCRALLGAELVAELAALPEVHADGEVLFCHGSPISDVRSFLPDPAPDEAELLADVTAEQLVFGHTHLPFERTAERGIELLNPGSVGMPFDGDPRAAYALLHENGAVERRRVAYDHESVPDRVREVLGADGEVAARRIEQARFDVG